MVYVKSGINDEMMKSAEDIIMTECRDLRSVLYKDLLSNAVKYKRDELDILDLKVINRALSEFRHAARIFKPYRNIKKVSIFGSARTGEDAADYQLAVKFGEQISHAGYMVITGAAEGIMKAGIEGAGAENSFGVKILLPQEKDPAKIIQGDSKLVNFKYFFTRKLFFVMEADAVALFPGGFGTHDEGFEVLTLLQTGKCMPMPVVLVEPEGYNYWEAWDEFIRLQLLTRGLISVEDLSLYRIVHTPEEAVKYISFFYSTYNSIRFVGEKLIVRLEKELLDVQLKDLSEKYADIISCGVIRKTLPLAEETDQPELISKPRISFVYNRKSAGRLNQMILDINRMGN